MRLAIHEAVSGNLIDADLQVLNMSYTEGWLHSSSISVTVPSELGLTIDPFDIWTVPRFASA